MQKNKIFWTVFALKCLDEIALYIEKESKSKSIAEKHIDKLISRVSQLEHFPESAAAEPLLKQFKTNSRFLVEGNYKIIYQYEENRVIVTDIFHVKQNPVKIIKRNKQK